jgi:hypothetical protein
MNTTSMVIIRDATDFDDNNNNVKLDGRLLDLI